MTESVLQAEPALAELADQFAAQWRKTRQAHEPIPARLSQAVALTALLPYSQVAKRLRLSPTDLKKRCLARPGMNPTETMPPAPAFIEVTGVAFGTGPALQALLIEVERPDGARLRVHAAVSLPLVSVLRAFLDAPGCCN